MAAAPRQAFELSRSELECIKELLERAFAPLALRHEATLGLVGATRAAGVAGVEDVTVKAAVTFELAGQHALGPGEQTQDRSALDAHGLNPSTWTTELGPS